jgi:hypothetical protein
MAPDAVLLPGRAAGTEGKTIADGIRFASGSKTRDGGSMQAFRPMAENNAWSNPRL